jgi:hypothetical protein
VLVCHQMEDLIADPASDPAVRSIPGLAYLPLAEGLHDNSHCWALDQRGHGCSAHAALLPVRMLMAGLPTDAALGSWRELFMPAYHCPIYTCAW